MGEIISGTSKAGVGPVQVSVIASSGVAQTLNCDGGVALFEVTEDADCVYTLEGAMVGVECLITLVRHSDGSTPTLPDALWANDLPIPATVEEGKSDVFIFVTYDGGETWFASAFVTNVTTTPVPEPPPEIASDTFNRDNGAIGLADTGQTWVEWDSTWSIDTNKVKCSSVAGATNGFVLINAETPDASVSADITMEAASYSGLVARFTDEFNLILLQPVAGVMRLYKLVAGVATELDDANAPTSPDGETHRWTISCNGDTIETYKDDVLAHSVTEAFNNTVESFGMRVYDAPNTTGRFDNFEIVAP